MPHSYGIVATGRSAYPVSEASVDRPGTLVRDRPVGGGLRATDDQSEGPKGFPSGSVDSPQYCE